MVVYCGGTDKYDLIVHKYEYEYDNNIYIALGQIYDVMSHKYEYEY